MLRAWCLRLTDEAFGDETRGDEAAHSRPLPSAAIVPH
jgi:hypothetical protein